MTNEQIRITQSDLLDIDRLAAKITAGADVNRLMDDDRSPVVKAMRGPEPLQYPLHATISLGNLEACRLLLAEGANPNELTPNDGYGGHAPLWNLIVLLRDSRSSRAQQKQWIELLLDAGADKNGIEPEKHVCPLYAAFVIKNVEAFELLVEAGAEIENARRPAGKNYPSIPLLECISSSDNDQQIALYLLRRGISDRFLLNGTTGLTPFQACVKRGMPLLVEYYVRELGEDPAQRTESGRTLMQLAGSPETKTLLRVLKTECAVNGSVKAPVVGNGTVAAGRKAFAPL